MKSRTPIHLPALAAIVVAYAAFLGSNAYAQNGNPCGGTNGNGEIVSIGERSFTLKLNENGGKGGDDLVVSLREGATIETPSGRASMSDLKAGERVTLVGDNNRDGTFTADAVMVCDGASGNAGTSTPITVRNRDPEAYERANGIIRTVTLLAVSLVCLVIIVFLLAWKKKSLVYALFFIIFYIYLYKVLDYTLLQFQSLLLLRHFVPDLMLNGFRDGTNVNLIPLVTLTLEDAKTSLLNIVMMLPFGFGLPFISAFRFKKVVAAGLLFSVAIESVQLVTGFMANTTFRVADVNDLIFNTAGAAIGYMVFVAFIRAYRRIFPERETLGNPIMRYIGTRPQADRSW